ncbi:multidrug effflux MFS transporter [Rodentibacter myodis]|uniref:Bcr/CflA family efflux transporter n=1 Tax=Rodentibacter myodis TaxID=1907939 RepID=A0A1V3JG74_9PAST|nr:multidrug effflux MFS transporter [Rodentibacter myodis]OOF55618.1 Bcr/CflA family drug resistance efflux transporter [Rodentibacter myodis]
MQQVKSINAVLLLIILSILMAFTSLSTDIYLPAMPQMTRDLNGQAELTVTGFLIGFALAQLLWGPISDRIGRKIPLYIGMVMFVIGSLGCAISSNIEQIIFWRVFQAFGACTAPMLARAIVRDLFDKSRAVQLMSTLMIIMAIAPISGPLIGGQILKISTWHTIFYLLAAIGGVMFLSLWLLPETLPQEKRASGHFWAVFRNYKILLGNRAFMTYTLCVTFYYVGQYAFIIGSPQVYIEFFHVEPQHFGWLFGINIMGVMLMSFLNRFLTKRFSLDQLLRTTTFFISIMGLLLAFFAVTQIGGLVSLMICIFFYFSMVGIIAACATVAALDRVPEMAGSGSALMGALQYGSGIISSLLLAWFADGSAWTMAWIMAISALASAIVMRIRVKKSNS